MALPLLAGSLLAGGGWLAGKSASGGIEIGTNKKQSSEVNVIAPFMPFIFQPTTDTTNTNNYIVNSPNSSVDMTSKKELSGASAPIIYSLPIETGQGQGSGTSGTGEGATGGGFDYMTLVVLGGLGFGAYYFLKGGKK